MSIAITDVRRDNLRKLIDAMGGATALALKLKYANGTYLSQLAGPNPTRTIGEKVARNIEETLKLPSGWMDTQNADLAFRAWATSPHLPASLRVVPNQKLLAQGKAEAAERQEAERHVQQTLDDIDRVISEANQVSGAAEQTLQDAVRNLGFKVVRTVALNEDGPRDLPVFGQVQGGFDGVEVDYQNPVEYIQRPPSLFGAKKACGVYVTGDSMEPRYYAGEIVLVDPRKPVRSGDFVVVELPDHRAIVKRLVRRNDNGALLCQLNPREEQHVPRSGIVGLYRIVGTVTE
ncbi:helix-turn-helix transcriptional regulator [Dongia sp.]|uniref:S24 family peptidase n=1 Tax=Dongia sp. TaxID=1977262 RepID=UPI0035AEDFF0